jgi:hypothetical protein
LNGILRYHQIDAPRLRLMRENKPTPPEEFLSYQTSARSANSRTTRLRSAELTGHLNEGSTLILDGVDELHEPIAELAENLERELAARIQVNMYAGWRTSPGFDVHWDGHDVLILQIHGRKQWKVYPMTRPYPVQSDPKDETPPKDPLWEGMLENGDMLYIPRGWWHVAVPVDEPTMHLTVGVHSAIGLEFMAWFADRLRENALVRQDLPRFGTAGEKESHLQCLRQAWEQAWHPELLDEYFAYLDSQARARPHLGLPWTAQSGPLPTRAWSIKWLLPRRINLELDGQSSIVVRGHGKEWTFAENARPVLQKLQANDTCSVDELYQSAAGAISRDKLEIFVQELVREGICGLS